MNIRKIYICENCRKIVNILDELLFVEEKSTRGFCCELCIEQFYTPVIQFFEDIENNCRKEMNLGDEDCLECANGPEKMFHALKRPDEAWLLSNELGDNYYSFITRYEQGNETIYLVVICLVYNFRPSFVLLATATKSLELLSRFQIGEQVDEVTDSLKMTEESDESTKEEIDEHVMNMLELKKSVLLSWLLERRTEDDVDIEMFSSYQHHERLTIDSADEIYKWQDAEGDMMFTYIKAHEHDGESFYYLVICILYVDDEGGQFALPVLSFPSRDPKLYDFFKKGERVIGALKN